MNSFRDAVSKGAHSGPLMPAKKPLRADADGLEAVPVPRSETRTTNFRGDDRHLLRGEQVRLKVGRKSHKVDLINLSGGGAMVRTEVPLKLWKKVHLVLGECDAAECVVRWVRGDRVGLEFAHETQVHGDPEVRAVMLLKVIQRSLPDFHAPVTLETAEAAHEAETQPAEEHAGPQRRDELRHPLIWSGEVFYDHDTTKVRLRNISERGALLDSPRAFPEGAEVLLDLGGAGQLFALVTWSRGDQLGLRFRDPFDIARLAKATPAVAPQRWTQPDYLRGGGHSDSPWASPWQRVSLPELKDALEGFLKR